MANYALEAQSLAIRTLWTSADLTADPTLTLQFNDTLLYVTQ